MSGPQERLETFASERGAGRMVRDYLDFLGVILSADALVLDAGCGRQGIYATSGLNRKHFRRALVGVDRVATGNPYVDQKHVGDLARLPFRDLSFDVVLCEWVAEHAEHPRRVLAEFARVLKPGGHLVVITANKRNPLVRFGWLMPTSWKDFLLGRLLGQADEDLFPLFMRFNERDDMRRIAADSGCEEVLFRSYPNPEYFRWNDWLLAFVLQLQEWTRSWRWIEPYRMYLLAAYRKGPPTAVPAPVNPGAGAPHALSPVR